jgi:hypothetical protein
MLVVLKERVFPQISVCHIYIKVNITAREMGVRQEETAKNSQQHQSKASYIHENT